MRGHFSDTQVVLNMFMKNKTFLKVKDIFNSLKTKFLRYVFQIISILALCILL